MDASIHLYASPHAAALAQSINAHAFTHKNHIFFNKDKYNPGTSEGKRLGAQELTHVRQQASSPDAPSIQRWKMSGSKATPQPFFKGEQHGDTILKPTTIGSKVNTSVGFGYIQGGLSDEEKPTSLSSSGSGTPSSISVFGGGQSIALRGEAKADYDGGTFSTTNVNAKKAAGCEGCEEDCLKVTGTLVSTFSVKTSVTLPSADDYPDLTECQRQRVQTAIQTKLGPHEQDHVRRFKKYNGTVNTPINLTICKTDFDSKVQEMHDSLAQARQTKVQADSDSIDPFHVDVDLNCKDKPAKK